MDFIESFLYHKRIFLSPSLYLHGEEKRFSHITQRSKVNTKAIVCVSKSWAEKKVEIIMIKQGKRSKEPKFLFSTFFTLHRAITKTKTFSIN